MVGCQRCVGIDSDSIQLTAICFIAVTFCGIYFGDVILPTVCSSDNS